MIFSTTDIRKVPRQQGKRKKISVQGPFAGQRLLLPTPTTRQWDALAWCVDASLGWRSINSAFDGTPRIPHGDFLELDWQCPSPRWGSSIDAHGPARLSIMNILSNSPIRRADKEQPPTALKSSRLQLPHAWDLKTFSSISILAPTERCEFSCHAMTRSSNETSSSPTAA